MSDCWVIVRSYSDDSGFEVLRVYDSQERAEQDLNLVHGDHGLRYESFCVRYITTVAAPAPASVPEA